MAAVRTEHVVPMISALAMRDLMVIQHMFILIALEDRAQSNTVYNN